MSPISISTGILISPITDWDNQGSAAPVDPNAFLLETGGTDYILLESGGTDYILLES